MREWKKVLSVVAVSCVAAALMVSQAEAQRIGPPVQIVGAPVAAEAVPARHVFAIGSKIYWVNSAGEMYYHLVHQRRVDRHIRLRGNVVAVTGQETRHIFPIGGNRIIIVTNSGELWAMQIRGDVLQPPHRLGGVTIQDIQNTRFMFPFGNRFIVINNAGDMWSYRVGRDTISPPMLIGGHTRPQAGYVPQFVFPYQGMIFVVAQNGEVWGWNPRGGRGHGRRMTGHGFTMRPDGRWLVQMNDRVYVIDARGALFSHALIGFRPPTGAAPPGGAPPPGGEPPAQ